MFCKVVAQGDDAQAGIGISFGHGQDGEALGQTDQEELLGQAVAEPRFPKGLVINAAAIPPHLGNIFPAVRFGQERPLGNDLI